MVSDSHYFNQSSIDQSLYFSVSGNIAWQKCTIDSAKWLFSATKFDVWTRILLKHFVSHGSWDVSLLDLGCGYGLISSFIALQYKNNQFSDLKKLHIDACDSSVLAKDVTEYNLNALCSSVKWLTYKVLHSDVLSDDYFSDKKYHIIITNPPFSAGKSVVKSFIEQSYAHLHDNGILWMVVPTNKWAKSYIKITEEIFWTKNIEIIALEAWYRVRTARK